MKTKRVYRKRQWTRQAARKTAEMFRRMAIKMKKRGSAKMKQAHLSKTHRLFFGCKNKSPRKISREVFGWQYKSMIRKAALADAYSKGEILQFRLVSRDGKFCGWMDECDPSKSFIHGHDYTALRVKPKEIVNENKKSLEK
ncbi:MAG: hypothetical protein WC497_05555 [Patescibacteria group bacterium]